MQKYEVDMVSLIAAGVLPVGGGYLGMRVFHEIDERFSLGIEPFIVVGVLLGVVAAYFVSRFLREYGDDGFRGGRYKRWLRGAKIENWHTVVNIINRENRKTNRRRKKAGMDLLAPIMIGPIPMPIDYENRHTIICASTGSGKSTVMEPMIASAVRRRDKMVVVDPNGIFFSKFGLSGDIILNPFDERSVGWSVYNEIRGDYDFARMAKSFIPPQINPEDEQWCTYTRDVLADTMRKMAEHNNLDQNALIGMLTREDTATLRVFLEETDSQGYFRDNAERAIASVQFMINKYIRPLRHMSQVGNTDFSIHDWLLSPVPSNLYISWREDMQSELRSLVSAWIDTVCATILSNEPGTDNRFWLFLDELQSLGRLESFIPAATKGRQHGLRIVGCIQDWSQLDESYGRDGTKTLLACFRNYVIFGAANAENSDRAAAILGTHQVEREQRTSSGKIGVGASKSVVQTTEPVIMDSEISNLPDLTGYVKFGQDIPIAKIKVPYIGFPKRHAAICLR